MNDAAASRLSAPSGVVLDDTIRGVPPGTSKLAAGDLAALRLHPADGRMALPLLTLDEPAFLHNRDTFMRHIGEHGVKVAPHGKTPMAPDLARTLVEGGAWGTTVADIRQAGVMLRHGLTRLILANEVGGPGGARRLAALVASRPDAEIYVFVDSLAIVEALAKAWAADQDLPKLRVLVELGAGRAGVRTLEQAEALADAVVASGGRLRLAGIATYEGSAAVADPAESERNVDALLALVAAGVRMMRARMVATQKLVVTAGGSGWFDRVVKHLKPAVDIDGNAVLVLRSGAIFFHDHGPYDRAMEQLDCRAGFTLGGSQVSAREAFRPALRVWAEVLSRPDPQLALCGMGMRDVSFDLGFPVPLNVYRNGRKLDSPRPGAVTKLNDQHGYLSLAEGADVRVGDVVEFGISHPCTCLHLYRMIFGVDADGRVTSAIPTAFG